RFSRDWSSDVCSSDLDFDVRPTESFLDGGFDGYRLVYAETPANPGLDICDIAAVAKAVHAAGGLFVVDNTTMTPFGQRPLDLGEIGRAACRERQTAGE